MMPLRQRESLIGRERPAGFEKRLANRGFLLGIALFHRCHELSRYQQ